MNDFFGSTITLDQVLADLKRVDLFSREWKQMPYTLGKQPFYQPFYRSQRPSWSSHAELSTFDDPQHRETSYRLVVTDRDGGKEAVEMTVTQSELHLRPGIVQDVLSMLVERMAHTYRDESLTRDEVGTIMDVLDQLASQSQEAADEWADIIWKLGRLLNRLTP